jgi:hypothetical protein
MNSKWMKRTIHEIALRNNFRDTTVLLIVNSQFEAVRNVMKNADPEVGKMPDIHMLKFATFHVKPGRLKFLKGKKYYQEERKRRQEEKYKQQQ